MQGKVFEVDGDAAIMIYRSDGTVPLSRSLGEIALTLFYLANEEHKPDEAERTELQVASLIIGWLAENASRPIIGTLLDEDEDVVELTTPPAAGDADN